MTGIRRERGGGVTLELDPHEAALLSNAVHQVCELLAERDGGGSESAAGGRAEVVPGVLDPFVISGSADRPADPALARLLPDAYRDDPEAAGEYRRFAESDLLATKRSHLAALLDTLGDGGEVSLNRDQVRAWMYALNDVRLALGTRLAIEEDYEAVVAGLDPTDPRLGAFALYEWLTALQDALVQSQTG